MSVRPLTHSISGLFDDSCTISSLGYATDENTGASGSNSTTPTTNVPCRYVPRSSAESFRLGKELGVETGTVMLPKVLADGTALSVAPKDTITLASSSGSLRVLGPARDEGGRYWAVDVERET